MSRDCSLNKNQTKIYVFILVKRDTDDISSKQCPDLSFMMQKHFAVNMKSS